MYKLYSTDKKGCTLFSATAFFPLEAPPRFELGNRGFADLGLTTWLWRHILNTGYQLYKILISLEFLWSGLRDSNSRLSPWQGDTLPLSYTRILCHLEQTFLCVQKKVVPRGGIEPQTRGFSVHCSTD